MKSTVVSAKALPLLLLSAVLACSESERATDPITGVTDVVPQVYGNCPTDAQAACDLYHGQGNTTVTAWCVYDGCFEMSYGEEVRIVAADEQGAFPRTFFAWSEGTFASADWASRQCIVADRGKKKTALVIPEVDIKCAVDLQTAQDLYYEHLASNPASGCLGWVECRQNASP